MDGMLTVAGGVIIGGGVLGLLWIGFSLAIQPVKPGEEETARALGLLMMIGAVVAAYLIVFGPRWPRPLH